MGQICHSHCCVMLWFCLSYKSRCVFVQFSSLYSQSKNKSCVQANTHARLSHGSACAYIHHAPSIYLCVLMMKAMAKMPRMLNMVDSMVLVNLQVTSFFLNTASLTSS